MIIDVYNPDTNCVIQIDETISNNIAINITDRESNSTETIYLDRYKLSEFVDALIFIQDRKFNKVINNK